MATFPSDRPGREGQAPPLAEQVAAVIAAMEVVLGGHEGDRPPTPVWRWSGRRWGTADRRWR